MYIHIHPNKQLHEGTLAVNADAVTADDVDEFFLRVDGATDGVHPCTFTIGTGSKQVSDHQQVDELRVRIILGGNITYM